MDILWDILTNGALIAAIVSWTVAQVVKAILYNIKHHSWSLKRIHGAGGMPSAHTAMVISTAVVIGRLESFNSPLFALSVLFAMIVIYDSTGVRAAVGQHSRLLNRLAREKRAADPEQTAVLPEKPAKTGFAGRLDRIWNGSADPDKPFEELLGHTLPEIAAGALIGILVGVLTPLM